MQQRVIAYWSRVDPQLGARIAAGLGYGGGGGNGSVASPEANESVASRANRA
jgi:hypothetical protein